MRESAYVPFISLTSGLESSRSVQAAAEALYTLYRDAVVVYL